MEQARFIASLNALAKCIPPGAFAVPGHVDCVTYVVLYRGEVGQHYRRAGREWTIGKGTVLYVGEGYLPRATAQFKRRGKVVGFAGRDFDDFIANIWPPDTANPSFEVYLAASNINKSVALEFEGILIREFNPPFNERAPVSTGWRTSPAGPDTRHSMHSALRIEFNFDKSPPSKSHQSEWDRFRCTPDGQRTKCWVEIPEDWIITRRSLRTKNNRPDTRPEELTHFASYPLQVGAWTTVAAHRAKNAGMRWERIKEILYYDSTYTDALGPIITITPPT